MKKPTWPLPLTGTAGNETSRSAPSGARRSTTMSTFSPRRALISAMPREASGNSVLPTRSKMSPYSRPTFFA